MVIRLRILIEKCWSVRLDSQVPQDYLYMNLSFCYYVVASFNNVSDQTREPSVAIRDQKSSRAGQPKCYAHEGAV